MSRVFLVPNHHYLGDRRARILLTKEMLEWPVYGPNADEKLMLTYIRALEALMELGQFDSEFCLKVNLEEKWLNYSCKCWGVIYLNEVAIVKFEWVTSLYEWPNLDKPAEIRNWTVKQWKDFFLDRINKKSATNMLAAKYNN